MIEPMTGQFWLATAQDRQHPGVLVVDDQTAPEVTVNGEFTPTWETTLMSGTDADGTAVYRRRPADDFSLYTVHGITAAGQRVTLLEAQRGAFTTSRSRTTQAFRGIQAVIGAHLPGRDHPFSGVRVRLQSAADMLASASR